MLEHRKTAVMEVPAGVPPSFTQIGPLTIPEKIVIQFSQEWSIPQGVGPTSHNSRPLNALSIYSPEIELFLLVKQRVGPYDRNDLLTRLGSIADLERPIKLGSRKHYVGRVIGDIVEFRQKHFSRAVPSPHSVEVVLEKDFFDLNIGIPLLHLVQYPLLAIVAIVLIAIPLPKDQTLHKILGSIGLLGFGGLLLVLQFFIAKLQVQDVIVECLAAGKSI